MTETARRMMLREAAAIVDGQRDAEYGGPEELFARIAGMWSEYKRVPFTTTDVALMMALLKIARLAETDGAHRDSWVDLAGYAACGLEVTDARRLE